jgi:signal recognition particle subunit SRP54
MIKRLGSIGSLASMIPGMAKVIDEEKTALAEKEMKKIEAIILSMTPKERQNHQILDGSRRKRIAQGSGTKVEDVNKLLKQYLEMRKMMSAVAQGGLGSLLGKAGLMKKAGQMKIPKIRGKSGLSSF